MRECICVYRRRNNYIKHTFGFFVETEESNSTSFFFNFFVVVLEVTGVEEFVDEMDDISLLEGSFGSSLISKF